jgi:hypothetical protein
LFFEKAYRTINLSFAENQHQVFVRLFLLVFHFYQNNTPRSFGSTSISRKIFGIEYVFYPKCVGSDKIPVHEERPPAGNKILPETKYELVAFSRNYTKSNLRIYTENKCA